MRIFYLVVLSLFTFQSCSSSDDSPMLDENAEMEMGGEIISSSSFIGDFIGSAHPTSGMAAINEAKTRLSFTNFKTDSGPVLEVYLATDPSASTYITLGALKGIDGNYEYDLPNNVDFKVYSHVIIWCVDFKVNFGYAVLK